MRHDISALAVIRESTIDRETSSPGDTDVNSSDDSATVGRVRTETEAPERRSETTKVLLEGSDKTNDPSSRVARTGWYSDAIAKSRNSGKAMSGNSATRCNDDSIAHRTSDSKGDRSVEDTVAACEDMGKPTSEASDSHVDPSSETTDVSSIGGETHTRTSASVAPGADIGNATASHETVVATTRAEVSDRR